MPSDSGPSDSGPSDSGPPDPGYAAHVIDLLDSALGQAAGRRMFGGWGVYHQGIMVALVAFDELYLKVDDQTRPRFEAAGGRPFVYEGKDKGGDKGGVKGKPVVMNGYWTPPEEALESPDALAPWARLAAKAALRAPPRPPRKKRARP